MIFPVVLCVPKRSCGREKNVSCTTRAATGLLQKCQRLSSLLPRQPASHISCCTTISGRMFSVHESATLTLSKVDTDKPLSYPSRSSQTHLSQIGICLHPNSKFHSVGPILIICRHQGILLSHQFLHSQMHHLQLDHAEEMGQTMKIHRFICFGSDLWVKRQEEHHECCLSQKHLLK